MDDKWRSVSCGQCCAGIKWSYGDEGPVECDCSGGIIYLRPKGHAFAWPGGPACGWHSEKDYQNGTPVMPFEWHQWTETEDQISKMSLNYLGGLDGNNIVHCSCGLVCTIDEHEEHVKEKRQEFIESKSVAIRL